MPPIPDSFKQKLAQLCNDYNINSAYIVGMQATPDKKSTMQIAAFGPDIIIQHLLDQTQKEIQIIFGDPTGMQVAILNVTPKT
jgi:hypothetical protein